MLRLAPLIKAVSILLVVVGLVLVASPNAARAAGTCAISVEPDRVHVGETFTITATGYEPNELAIGFAALDSGGSPALAIQLDATGSLTRTVTAKPFMIGTQSVNLTGDLSNCGATAPLTVLPAVGTPATDMDESPAQPGAPLPWAILATVWLVGLVAGWRAVRRPSTTG